MLIKFFTENHKLGLCSSMTVSPIGRIVDAGAEIDEEFVLSWNLAHRDPFSPETRGAIAAPVCLRNAVAVSGDLFRQLKGYDTSIKGYVYQDIDLSLRAAELERENWCCTDAKVVSLGSYFTEPVHRRRMTLEDDQERRLFVERQKAKRQAARA